MSRGFGIGALIAGCVAGLLASMWATPDIQPASRSFLYTDTHGWQQFHRHDAAQKLRLELQWQDQARRNAMLLY
jgi:hypothetical protein